MSRRSRRRKRRITILVRQVQVAHSQAKSNGVGLRLFQLGFVAIHFPIHARVQHARGAIIHAVLVLGIFKLGDPRVTRIYPRRLAARPTECPHGNGDAVHAVLSEQLLEPLWGVYTTEHMKEEGGKKEAPPLSRG